MKNKILFKLIMYIFIIGIGVADMPGLNAVNTVKLDKAQVSEAMKEIPTRESILAQIEELKIKLHRNPDDVNLKLAYAGKLFQLGDFSESKKIINSLPKIDEVIYLSAKIEYVNGNYKDAEKLYDKLNQSNSKDYKEKAQTGLLYTYYQTNQFNKAKNLTAALEKEFDEPLKKMMIGFRNKKPYTVNWNNNSEVRVPFIADEPLPVVEVEINGKKINAIIDTGASDFYIDEKTAVELNIYKLSTNTGKYAGGIKVETTFGLADSLSFNNVKIKNIPVIIASLNQFSSLYDGVEINGIVSTKILKQFLATMDYTNSQLILRPRNKQGKALLSEYLFQYNTVNEMPFSLSASHFMTAKGDINGKKSLNFFMDSGLADEKSGLILLEQTMDFTNIPMPKTEKGPQDSVGGLGGNDFEIGEFTIDEFRLGKLPLEKNIWALYGVLESSFNYEESNDFIMDGLVSHNFLKKYSWTIDFDTMIMTFAQ